MVLSAALKEFGENSFEDASLNSILKNSGISKGTFYYHFKNKEAIYFFLLKEGFEKKWRFIGEHMKGQGAEIINADIFDRFLLQAKMGVLFAETYPQYHNLSKMFLKEKHTDIYEKAVEYIKADSGQMLSDMIGKAYKKGEFEAGFDEEFIKKILSHLFTVFDDIFDRGEGTEAVLRELEEYIRFMKYGLKPR
jgi:AcrR family transcriptional regulator